MIESMIGVVVVLVSFSCGFVLSRKLAFPPIPASDPTSSPRGFGLRRLPIIDRLKGESLKPGLYRSTDEDIESNRIAREKIAADFDGS